MTNLETAEHEIAGIVEEVEAPAPETVEQRDELARLERMLALEPSVPKRHAPDQYGEACQAAWDGIHRTIAEGGNQYLE